MGILILFGILNILGVKKAGIVQTILAALLGISVVTLTIWLHGGDFISLMLLHLGHM